MLRPGSSYSSRISKWGLTLVCTWDVCWFYTQTVRYSQQGKGLRSAHIQVWIPTLLNARCVFLGALLNISPGTDFFICLTEVRFHCFVEIQWDIGCPPPGRTWPMAFRQPLSQYIFTEHLLHASSVLAMGPEQQQRKASSLFSPHPSHIIHHQDTPRALHTCEHATEWR